MTSNGAIKQEPFVPGVLNIKNEPNEPGHLKITNVFSITAISAFPGTESAQVLNSLRRNTSVQKYDDHQHQSNFSCPARMRKQIFEQPKKEDAILECAVTMACENCTATFKTFENLAHHRLFCKRASSPSKKQEIMITCDICSTVFFNVESLEEHVVEMHVVDKDFKCTHCTKSFITQEELDSHMAEHEIEEEGQGSRHKSHKCPVCARTFARKTHVKTHMMTHDFVKSFKCKLCPYTFLRRESLRRHERETHEKVKKFKCSKCTKSFFRNYKLQDHIRNNCLASFNARQSIKTVNKKGL